MRKLRVRGGAGVLIAAGWEVSQGRLCTTASMQQATRHKQSQFNPNTLGIDATLHLWPSLCSQHALPPSAWFVLALDLRKGLGAGQLPQASCRGHLLWSPQHCSMAQAGFVVLAVVVVIFCLVFPGLVIYA